MVVIVPRIASGIETSRVARMSSPSRLKTSCGATVTSM